MTQKSLADQKHRELALDVSTSFIVQAPAGSGKTELLTLRFLKLLAGCEQPEQVLAITFTKKAANEMAKRIADALRWAAECQRTGAQPDSSLDRQRLAIALQVLEQDAKLNWHLLDNPARLRVQTIDSFCFYLANQLPVLSQLGGNPRVNDDVTVCFNDAISNTLAELETNATISDDVAAVLMHLDNDIGKVQRLLVGLLHKRDQWLTHVLQMQHDFSDAQQYLQTSLVELVTESLEDARAALAPYQTELIPLINFAADNLQQSGSLAIADFEPLTQLPAANYSAMPYWLHMLNVLLTKTGEASFRKRLDKNCGFPAAEKSDKLLTALRKQQKDAMTTLLAQASVDPDLLDALDYVRILPDPALDEDSWRFLAALARVLAHLSTQLLLSFRRYRVIDYTQTSSAARSALGDEDIPTDLALALDHRIQHVLVDEFQDTSQMQLDILQQITAGWEPEDGRTIFLVGDAMQSCYAFRNANVGIYLDVKENGLGNVPLTALTLATNFRSQEIVVEWVNEVFSGAFPQHANISRGAVPYTPSVAVHEALESRFVQVNVIAHEKDETEAARQTEAAQIVTHIQQLQRTTPGESIAILVRARPHLQLIIPALREAGIQWQSTDIDKLTKLPVVADLFSLTRAILNPADRLAWLALLRAPWCGLTIADLHAIAAQAGSGSILGALQAVDDNTALSPDAGERVSGIMPALNYAMRNRFHVSLRTVLENCFELLGGNRIITTIVEKDSVAHYLNMVSENEVSNGIPDIDAFYTAVSAAFVPNRLQESQADVTPVHLLTMHKAKGLEFDHVILPGLARKPKTSDKQLLQWHERRNRKRQSRLYLATLSATGSTDNALYSLLSHEQKYKERLESTRLLYIAVTRARSSVLLLATQQRNTQGNLKPLESSLLARIWPQLEAQPDLMQELAIAQGIKQKPETDSGNVYGIPTPIHRLAQPLTPESAHIAYLANQAIQSPVELPDAFTPAQEARLGTLIHKSLEAISRSGDISLNKDRISKLRHYWGIQLRSNAGSDKELQSQLTQVEQALTLTLQNTELAWLFAGNAGEQESEAGISRRHSAGVNRFSVDRSVIDADGTRWIIDYKTAMPVDGQSEAQFVAEQIERYRPQLTNYRALYTQIEKQADQRPVKCALLFTGLGQLMEIS